MNMVPKTLRTAFCGLLLLGLTNAAHAIDFTGTLDLTSFPIDIDVFDLGSALNGLYDVTFTPGMFNTSSTLVAFGLSAGPVGGPGPWWVDWSALPGVTTSLAAIYGPLALTTGTNYYLFAAGASFAPNTIAYTLTVSAVPEAHVWAMMLAGLAFMGWHFRRLSATRRLESCG